MPGRKQKLNNRSLRRKAKPVGMSYQPKNCAKVRSFLFYIRGSMASFAANGAAPWRQGRGKLRLSV